MSSSKKKQARKQQEAVNTKEATAVAEAKKLKRYTVTFWVVIALVMVVFVTAIASEFVVSPIAKVVKNNTYPNTEAIQVGDYSLSSVELNYYYVDSVYNYINTLYSYYGSYYYYFMPFSVGSGYDLADQVYDEDTGETWSDYFLDTAVTTIKSTYALYTLALKEGYTMTEDEQATLDETLASLEESATENGYKNVKAYLRNVYGYGADLESYTNYLTVSCIASSYYSYYSDSLTFTAEDLAEFVGDEVHLYNLYTYAYYQISIEDFLEGGTEDEEGEITYSDDEILAAIKLAKQAAEKLTDGTYASLEEFKDALRAMEEELHPAEDEEDDTTEDDGTETQAEEEVTEEGTTEEEETEEGTTEDEETEEEETLADPDNYTLVEDKAYSSNNSLFRDWLSGKTEKTAATEDEEAEYEYIARNEGDVTIISNLGETEDEYDLEIEYFYVLYYCGCDTQEYTLKDVRHILFSVGTSSDDYGSEGDDGTITFPDEEVAAEAKANAEALLATWLENADDMDLEEYFAQLANENSDDDVESAPGGLYEKIYKGQMVTQFEDWCFDESRQAGDYGIVETKYGYHIMYFVGNSQDSEGNDLTYRNYLITEDLRDETVDEWLDELIENISFELKKDSHLFSDMDY